MQFPKADWGKMQQALTNLECCSRDNKLEFKGADNHKEKISVDLCLRNELDCIIAYRERERSWCLRQWQSFME